MDVMRMRILGILAVFAAICVGHPAFAYGDAAIPAAQAVADAAQVFDWMLLYLRIKVVLATLIVAAIAGLAHLAQRSQHSRSASGLAALRI
jgi:hypothetical protein